jgi:hypothetical protein
MRRGKAGLQLRGVDCEEAKAAKQKGMAAKQNPAGISAGSEHHVL